MFNKRCERRHQRLQKARHSLKYNPPAGISPISIIPFEDGPKYNKAKDHRHPQSSSHNNFLHPNKKRTQKEYHKYSKSSATKNKHKKALPSKKSRNHHRLRHSQSGHKSLATQYLSQLALDSNLNTSEFPIINNGRYTPTLIDSHSSTSNTQPSAVDINKAYEYENDDILQLRIVKQQAFNPPTHDLHRSHSAQVNNGYFPNFKKHDYGMNKNSKTTSTENWHKFRDKHNHHRQQCQQKYSTPDMYDNHYLDEQYSRSKSVAFPSPLHRTDRHTLEWDYFSIPSHDKNMNGEHLSVSTYDKLDEREGITDEIDIDSISLSAEPPQPQMFMVGNNSPSVCPVNQLQRKTEKKEVILNSVQFLHGHVSQNTQAIQMLTRKIQMLERKLSLSDTKYNKLMIKVKLNRSLLGSSDSNGNRTRSRSPANGIFSSSSPSTPSLTLEDLFQMRLENIMRSKLNDDAHLKRKNDELMKKVHDLQNQIQYQSQDKIPISPPDYQSRFIFNDSSPILISKDMKSSLDSHLSPMSHLSSNYQSKHNYSSTNISGSLTPTYSQNGKTYHRRCKTKSVPNVCSPPLLMTDVKDSLENGEEDGLETDDDGEYITLQSMNNSSHSLHHRPYHSQIQQSITRYSCTDITKGNGGLFDDHLKPRLQIVNSMKEELSMTDIESVIIDIGYDDEFQSNEDAESKEAQPYIQSCIADFDILKELYLENKKSIENRRSFNIQNTNCMSLMNGECDLDDDKLEIDEETEMQIGLIESSDNECVRACGVIISPICAKMDDFLNNNEIKPSKSPKKGKNKSKLKKRKLSRVSDLYSKHQKNKSNRRRSGSPKKKKSNQSKQRIHKNKSEDRSNNKTVHSDNIHNCNVKIRGMVDKKKRKSLKIKKKKNMSPGRI